jgi:hypothetical protein
MSVEGGHFMAKHRAGTVMEVSNSGTENLNAFVLFVVDADKPFFVPTISE